MIPILRLARTVAALPWRILDELARARPALPPPGPRSDDGRQPLPPAPVAVWREEAEARDAGDAAAPRAGILPSEQGARRASPPRRAGDEEDDRPELSGTERMAEADEARTAREENWEAPEEELDLDEAIRRAEHHLTEGAEYLAAILEVWEDLSPEQRSLLTDLLRYFAEAYQFLGGE